MSHYKPYPTYKDSGVEWLGQVPEHWIVSRLRHITNGSLSYGANEAAESDDLRHPRFIRITDLNEDGTLRDDTFKSLPPDVARPYLLKDGDILLARSGATVGKSFLYRRDMGDACYAGYLIRARLLESKFIPKLFWYCTQSSYYWDFIAGSNIQATIQNVSGEKYSNLWLAVPPVTEQRSIVSNLDRETARIDALIEKKTRFIELLREKRQALITHAVTKGLDPNVKMKDSGVEWLGEVPEHWGVRSFKHLAGIRYGIGEPPVYRAEGTPLIRATNVDAGSIRSGGVVYVDPADIPDKRIIWLAPGDIIVVRSGAYTGDSAIVQEHHCPAIAGFDMVVSPKRVNPFFLQYALLSRYLKSNQIDLQKMRAAQPHLNAEELGSCFVLVPPSVEQTQIVEFLYRSTRRVDGVISKTERSINLLKERRSALITAAVTGQIDLRGPYEPGP